MRSNLATLSHRLHVLLPALIVLAFAGVCPAANAIRNGDFEGPFTRISDNYSLPEGWKVNNGNKMLTLLAKEDGGRPGSVGKGCLRVEGTGPGSWFGAHYDINGLEVGREYLLRYWIKVVNEGTSAAIEFSPAGKPEILAEAYPAGDWRQVTFGFISIGATYRMDFRGRSIAAGKTLVFLLDDVELLPLDEAGPSAEPQIEPAPKTAYVFKWAFDFGAGMTPLLEGYQRINQRSAYARDRGWGFTSLDHLVTGGALERLDWMTDKPAVGNALTCDWLTGRGGKDVSHEFVIDLPNGDYRVHLLVGNPSSQPVVPYFNIYAEGNKRTSVMMNRNSNLIADPTFAVRVTDGQLNLRFASDGLKHPDMNNFGWQVNALVVYPAADRLAAQQQLELDESAIWRVPLNELGKWKLVPAAAPANPHQPTDDEKKRGFVLFTTDCTGGGPQQGPLGRETVPTDAMVAAPLTARLTPGEYEPILLGILPLRPTDQLSVTIESDAGAPALEVRKVRFVPSGKKNTYSYRPLLLERFEAFDLTPGQTEGLWLTAHSTADAAPGHYKAVLHLWAAGQRVASVPVKMQVLPFTLQTPPHNVWGMYYYWEKQLERNEPVLVDMREHGITGVTVNMEGDMLAMVRGGQPLPVYKQLELLKRLGIMGPHPYHCTEPHSGAIWGVPFDKSNPQLSEELAELIKKMAGAVLAEIAARDLPPVLFYMADEANEGFRNKMAAQLYRTVKQVPGVKTYATLTLSGLPAMKPWVDYRCYAKNDARDKLLGKDITAEGAQFWYYSPSHQYDVGNSRRYAGFVMWGRELTGYFRWHFYDPPSMGNPLNGMQQATYWGPAAMVYPGTDGTDVPTIGWEMCREGVDDFRYLYTLEQKLARSSGDRAKQIAAELAKLKQETADSGPPANAWTGQRYDQERTRVIDWIMELK